MAFVVVRGINVFVWTRSCCFFCSAVLACSCFTLEVRLAHLWLMPKHGEPRRENTTRDKGLHPVHVMFADYLYSSTPSCLLAPRRALPHRSRPARRGERSMLQRTPRTPPRETAEHTGTPAHRYVMALDYRMRKCRSVVLHTFRQQLKQASPRTATCRP